MSQKPCIMMEHREREDFIDMKCESCGMRVGSHTIKESIRCRLLDSDPAPKYTVANVGKYIKHDPASDDMYEGRTDNGRVTTRFIWNCKHEKLQDIACEEHHYRIGDKRKNLMWVEELKRIADWKEGEYIYASLKSNADGYFSVHYKKDKIQFDWFNLIVEPSGYVCMESMNLYTLDSDEDIKCGRNFIRVESVYNDYICKTLKKKKAKAKAKK